MRRCAYNFPVGLNPMCYIKQVFEKLKEHPNTQRQEGAESNRLETQALKSVIGARPALSHISSVALGSHGPSLSLNFFLVCKTRENNTAHNDTGVGDIISEVLSIISDAWQVLLKVSCYLENNLRTPRL